MDSFLFMNFINDFSALTSLLDKNRTWKLLRSDNAPLVMAFLKNLFSDEREVSYEKARAELKECFQDIKTAFGTELSNRQSSDYLRYWMEQGWIIEMDGFVTMTDAAQKAIDFTQMLESRVVSTSATHLQILQNEVKQLFIDVSTDKKVRIGTLLKQKRELDSRIESVKMGGGSFLTPAEQREKMRTIYELAERLPADFRKVEEETREIDRNTRIRMIEHFASKGQVLEKVLEEERKQRLTEYGTAYDGFFRMICNTADLNTFKYQIEELLKHKVASHLKPGERFFLRDLTGILVAECERVRKVRARIDENIRFYLENTDFAENRAVDRLLTQLEQIAVKLKEAPINLRTEKMNFQIDSGSVDVDSIDAYTLRSPDEIADFSDIRDNTESGSLSQGVLNSLDTVRMSEVRDNIRRTLGRASVLSVAEIIRRNKIHYGLSEVVAYVRAAHEFGAEYSDEKDVVEVADYKKKGKLLKITIPRQLVSSHKAAGGDRI